MCDGSALSQYSLEQGWKIKTRTTRIKHKKTKKAFKLSQAKISQVWKNFTFVKLSNLKLTGLIEISKNTVLLELTFCLKVKKNSE